MHPEADAEVAAQIDFYNRREAGLGERFYRHVLSCLEWIADNATLPRRRGNYYRVNLRAFPFCVIYVVKGDLVWVLAVARGSRQPGYWKTRAET